MTTHPFTMTINLNVLNHLGIGLYSSVPAVLSEVVANAWDADAKRVDIEIRPERDEIVITDDGVGMTRDEVNQKYLHVGYQRRKDGSPTTAFGRHVMGRKGIGKLSVFAIARFVEVYTASKGSRSGLRMDRKAIKELMEDGEKASDYHPSPIPDSEVDIEVGTRIVLREFDKKIAGTESHLRRRLARRFSVIGPRHKFEVSVQGIAVSPTDRDYYSKLEFVWSLGPVAPELREACGNALEIHEFPNSVGSLPNRLDQAAPDTKALTVTGWLGTVDVPDSIDPTNNAVVVMAHGKLVHEDLLPSYREAGIYADYVIGEVNADFLDADNLADIVTSGRQSIKEGDPRWDLLVKYVGVRLKEIKARWTNLRQSHGTKKALEHPVLREWFAKLGPDRRKTAEKMFGKIEALRLGDQEAKTELYKSSLLAFEKLSLQDSLSALDAVESESDFLVLTRLFGSVDEIEAVHYYQIAKGRLAVIREFEGLVPEAKEKILQRYLFDHLWLMDASWERAATNARIEEAVTAEFSKIKLTDEERAGRIDLRYRTAAGKHIVIELKKYAASVSAAALAGQVQKYHSALLKCLEEHFPEEPTDIEIVCVLGAAPSPKDQPSQNRKLLRAVGARWYTYDQLIADALDSYSEYLAREKEVRELVALIERLGDHGGS